MRQRQHLSNRKPATRQQQRNTHIAGVREEMPGGLRVKPGAKTPDRGTAGQTCHVYLMCCCCLPAGCLRLRCMQAGHKGHTFAHPVCNSATDSLQGGSSNTAGTHGWSQVCNARSGLGSTSNCRAARLSDNRRPNQPPCPECRQLVTGTKQFRARPRAKIHSATTATVLHCAEPVVLYCMAPLTWFGRLP